MSRKGEVYYQSGAPRRISAVVGKRDKLGPDQKTSAGNKARSNLSELGNRYNKLKKGQGKTEELLDGIDDNVDVIVANLGAMTIEELKRFREKVYNFFNTESDYFNVRQNVSAVFQKYSKEAEDTYEYLVKKSDKVLRRKQRERKKKEKKERKERKKKEKREKKERKN